MFNSQGLGKSSLFTIILILVHGAIFFTLLIKQDDVSIPLLEKTLSVDLITPTTLNTRPRNSSSIAQPTNSTSKEETKEPSTTPNEPADTVITKGDKPRNSSSTIESTEEPREPSTAPNEVENNRPPGNQTYIATKPLKPSTSIKSKNTVQKWKKETVLDREGTSAFLQLGGTVADLDKRYKTLCRISKGKTCYSNQIADSTDQAVIFAPMYAYYQEPQLPLYHMHTNFLAYAKTIGMPSIVIEAVFPQKKQKYLVTSPGKEPWEIQITIEDSFYYRENLLNVAAKKTLEHWEYLIWIDGHQQFENIYWWEEAIYKMEHFASVNFFQSLGHLDESNRTINYLVQPSVMYTYQHTQPMRGTGYFAGNAWGIRKELYLEIDYILDTCIAGGCDYSYSIASMRNTDDWNGFASFPHYFGQLKPWIEKTHQIFKGSSSVIRGYLAHFWHISIFDYFGIQQKMAHCCYDIEQDTYRDANFTLKLKSAQVKSFFPYTNN